MQRFHEGLMDFFERMFQLELPKYDENQLLKEDFRPLIRKSPKLLQKRMEELVPAFADLSESEKDNVRLVFESNQNIAAICSTEVDPLKYADIENNAFRKQLKEFFDPLWDRFSSGKNLNQEARKHCKTIHDHYKEFRYHARHQSRVCPFCGLMGLKAPGPNRRAPYDHFLPKSNYPFVGINFQNLAPICTDCNSVEKKALDTAFVLGKRTKVFSPYEEKLSDNHLSVQIQPKERYRQTASSATTLLKGIDWEWAFWSNQQEDERLEAWDALFKVRERFKEELEYHEKQWFDDVKTRYRNWTGDFDSFCSSTIGELEAVVLRTERAVVKLAYTRYLLQQEGMAEDLALLVKK